MIIASPLKYIQDFIGLAPKRERDPFRLIPYFDHVAPDIMALRDGGGIMAQVQVRGAPFHLSNNGTRNGQMLKHFAMLQLLADPLTEITEHLVCHGRVAPSHVPSGGSSYREEFMARYDRGALGKLRSLDWYISIVVRQGPMEKGARLDEPRLIAKLNGKVRTVMAAMQSQSPRRLGIRRNAQGTPFSEIAEALELIRTTRHHSMPLAGPLGAMPWVLYRDRVTHGPLGFMITEAGGVTNASFGRMFVLGAYPKRPVVGMMDGLISDTKELMGARWVLTNSIRPETRAATTDRIKLAIDRMEQSGIKSDDDLADLEAALGEVSSAEEIRGFHNWSLAVHADDMRQLDEKASALVDTIAGSGCTPTAAGIAGEAAYWAQWPGNQRLGPAPARIGLRRFAMLSSLDGYPVGNSADKWGSPIMRFATAGGTAYDHHLHDEQLPHTLFLGPSRSGKTACLGSMITAATALIDLPDRPGTIFLLDKDRSNKLAVVNNGGSYTELRAHEDSGAAPLLRLENTLSGRAAAVRLISGMILSDGRGPISHRAETRLEKGVAFVMRLPPERRSIGAVHAWLPPAALDPSESAARLSPWCSGNRLGWAFDGERDDIEISNKVVGIDLTKLLKEGSVLPVMAAYLLHLAGEKMDGRRFIFIVEEAKFLLPKPEFAEAFEDIILTGGKKNVALWAAIQQPEALLSHPVGVAILGQCRTRFLFKNERANENAYCGGGKWGDGLHCTPQEFRQIREGMTVGAWSVLIQRPGKSVLCRFDLSSMSDDLLIVSGTPELVNLWDRIADTRAHFWKQKEEAKA